VSINKRIREIENKGYIVTKTNGQHLRITHPAKSGTVFASATPSDNARDAKQLKMKLRHVFGKE